MYAIKLIVKDGVCGAYEEITAPTKEELYEKIRLRFDDPSHNALPKWWLNKKIYRIEEK